MKIGTDISLKVCRAEGYLIMNYNSRKLIKNNILQKDVYVNFKATFGYLSHTENGFALNNEFTRVKGVYSVDVEYNFNDLIEIYYQNEKGLSVFADYKNYKPDFENPTVYDMLNLASDINSYCGLN